MQDEHGQLDRVLDSALATYADPGPASGLERRILSRIANEASPAPRRRWLAWAIALPVAVGLLLFAVLAGSRLVHAPSSIPPQTRILALQSEGSDMDASGAKGRIESVAPANQSSPDTKMQPPHAVLETKSAPLPKLDVFPTPQPLSPEERALVEFAAHAPQSERESLMAAQREADASLRITAIEIMPLESPAAGEN